MCHAMKQVGILHLAIELAAKKIECKSLSKAMFRFHLSLGDREV